MTHSVLNLFTGRAGGHSRVTLLGSAPRGNQLFEELLRTSYRILKGQSLSLKDCERTWVSEKSKSKVSNKHFNRICLLWWDWLLPTAIWARRFCCSAVPRLASLACCDRCKGEKDQEKFCFHIWFLWLLLQLSSGIKFSLKRDIAVGSTRFLRTQEVQLNIYSVP